MRVVAASYSSPADVARHHAYTGGPLDVTLALESDMPRVVNSIAVILYDEAGVKLVNADTLAIGETLQLRGGTTEVRFEIAALHLNPGTYTIGWWVADAFGTVYDFVDTGFRVEVLDSVRGFGVRPRPGSRGVHVRYLTVDGDGTPRGQRAHTCLVGAGGGWVAASATGLGSAVYRRCLHVLPRRAVRRRHSERIEQLIARAEDRPLPTA